MQSPSTRLFRLLSLLQSRRFWAGTELAQRLDITQRTVRRDIEKLRSLGYRVSSSAGVAGGYQLDVGATLPPMLLDDDEALAIALSLRTAASGTVTGAQEAAVRALAKLERLMPKRLRRRVRAMQDAVIPMYVSPPRVDASTLTALASASRDHECVRFRYVDRDGRKTRRDVEPHGLVHTGVRWYLAAFDRTREDWRSFRVDRIADTPQPHAHFVPRAVPEGDVASYIERSVGAALHDIRAEVVIHAPIGRVKARVPGLAERLTELSPRRCLLETGAHSLTDLVWLLALVDENFDVRGPPELAEKISDLGSRFSKAAQKRRY